MKRRDFIKAVAVAPARTLAGEEKALTLPCRIRDVHCDPEPAYGVVSDVWEDSFNGRLGLWGPHRDGQRAIMTIHKNGLDVRFTD